MPPVTLQTPHPKILVVKLADLGDVLTATPALRALREAYPQAVIDLLLTHHTCAAMRYSTQVNTLIPSDNFRFFNPQEALKPGLLKEAFATLRRIRQGRYDAVVILHHLTTQAGALKYAAIAWASGAKTVIGLAPPGRRANFLSHAATDLGFGVRHEIDYWLDVVGLLGAATANRAMEMAVSPDDDRWAEEQVAPLAGCGPLIVIHPGSGGFSVARRWPAAHFAAVADALAEQGGQIILVGAPTDGADAVKTAMRSPALDLTGQTSLHQLAALLHRANLFIGGDSGVSHLAATAPIPMIAIFGPTNAAAWGPQGQNRVILQADIPCAPCAYVEHAVGLRQGCEARTCLKLITPAMVIDAAAQLPGQNPPPAPRAGNSGGYAQAGILGVKIHALTFAQTLAEIEKFIARGGPHQITTVNPEFVVAAQTDPVFRQIINRASLAFADGTGLLKAARWLNQPLLPERIPGVDMVEALANLSAQKGWRLYFLGARPGVAEKTIAVLSGRYPGMQAAGAFAGSPRAEDEDAIVEKIIAARADVVFVAYGAPAQDKWIARNMTRLNATVLVGVGGSFDFISGTAQRAPVWVQRLNLEWLHRFVRQPARWRRMWNAVPRFLWLVWREKLKGG